MLVPALYALVLPVALPSTIPPLFTLQAIVLAFSVLVWLFPSVAPASSPRFLAAKFSDL